MLKHNISKQINCNCPLCTNGKMNDGAVYKCIKYNGVMGLCQTGTGVPSVTQVTKVFNDYYHNIKSN